MRTPWIPLLLVALLPAPALAVDGVVEINQASASGGGITPGDGPGFPITISETGSYRLTSNIQLNSRSVSAIEITAGDVTLDLNGFAIRICATGLCGIGSQAAIQGGGQTGVTIRNGRISGAGGGGVNLGNRSRVEDLEVRNCGGRGIQVFDDSLVSRVIVTDSGSVGVAIGQRSILRDSTVSGSESTGVRFRGNPLIVNTIISNNAGALAIELNDIFERGGYRECIITGNAGTAEVQPITSTIKNLGNNICGTDTICP